MKSDHKWQILIVHGPNLNLLGEREPDVYGPMTLNKLNVMIKDYLESKNCSGLFFQSNHEGILIDFLHDQRKTADGVIINPGALTHYSYALHDALKAILLPAVEVHLSDIHARENFRKISVTKPACIAQISGLGTDSYLRGIDRLLEELQKK